MVGPPPEIYTGMHTPMDHSMNHVSQGISARSVIFICIHFGKFILVYNHLISTDIKRGNLIMIRILGLEGLNGHELPCKVVIDHRVSCCELGVSLI